jgi:hypothetical protein
MCPFCFATLGLIVAGTVSTGGLAALAVKVSRKKNQTTEIVPSANEGSNGNANTIGG